MSDQLPEGWTTRTLQALGDLGGRFSDGDWVESKDQDQDGNVRLLQLADVGVAVFRDRSNRWMRPDQVVDVNGQPLATNDVLIARMPEPIGRACLMPSLPHPALTCVDVAVLRVPASVVLPGWAMYALNAPAIRAEIAAMATGTTRQRVSRRHLGSVSLPIPPYKEQQRIVSVLESTFTNLAVAQQTAEGLKRRAATMELSMLNALLGGDWNREALGLVASVQLGRQRSPKDHTGENMVRYLRAANATWDGLDLGDVKLMNFTRSEVETFRLLPGDILLNEASGSPREVGKPVVWKAELAGDVCFQNTLIRVRPGERLRQDFAYMILRQAALRGYWAEQARGVGIAHIGVKRLMEFAVPLPPVEEQDRLASVYQSQLELVRIVRRQLDAVLQSLDAVTGSVLQAALEGRLVPQHGGDQPAEPQLKHLEAAAAAAGAARTVGKCAKAPATTTEEKTA